MTKNKRQLSVAVVMTLLLVLNGDTLFAAVEWPWQQTAEQKAKNSNITSNPSSTAVMEQSTGDSRNALQQIKKSAAAIGVSSSDLQSPGLRQPATLPPVVQGQGAARGPNSFTILAPQRNANYEEAVKMQAKLNDLLRVTSEMDRLNRSKVVAVQSMIDKARMNQSLLKTLATPSDAALKAKKGDADQILLSKKLRGMREDAEKQIALAQSHKDSVLRGSHKKA